jgi:hypothetical protein
MRKRQAPEKLVGAGFLTIYNEDVPALVLGKQEMSRSRTAKYC